MLFEFFDLPGPINWTVLVHLFVRLLPIFMFDFFVVSELTPADFFVVSELTSADFFVVSELTPA